MTAVLIFSCATKTASAASLRNTSNNLGLVGYWSLNDATGTKATDFSGRGNTGTLTNMEVGDWITAKKSYGLDFDGTDERVVISGPSSIYALTTDLSVFAWVKTTDTAWEGFSNGAAGSCGWGIASFSSIGGTGQLTVCTGSTWRTGGHTNISDGSWHHVGYTLSSAGSGTLQYYKDGLADGSAITTAGAHASAGTSLTMGSDQAGSFPFQGQLDDARVYNRVLSASEVYSLYNDGQALVRAKDNTGLLGYWSFDDATGTTATDFSGNGKTATLTGGPTWVAGKRGKAVNFDGTDDYVEMPTSFSFGALPLTMSFWTYPTSANQAYFTSDGGFSDHGFYFSTYGGGGMYVGYYISNWSTALENVASFTQNTWSHVVLTIDSTNGSRLYVNGVLRNSNATPPTGANTTNWQLGKQFNWANYFQGKMDDVRMYNRALTAQQVADLYNAGATTANPRIATVSRNGLVGYWNLDDGTSTKATDFSGSGNTGTLTGGPTWFTSRRGKVLNFDGTDDYVVADTSAVNLGSAISVSLWVMRGTSATTDGILQWASASQSGAPFVYLRDASGVLTWYVNGGFTLAGGTLSDNLWTQIGVTWDGTTWKSYFNGVQNATYTAGQTNQSTATKFWFGQGYDGFWLGAQDDVRVYNRALSATEVLTLFNSAGGKGLDVPYVAPVDTTAPVVSAESKTLMDTCGSATYIFYWTTDESSDTAVEYGLTASYGSTASTSNSVTSHNQSVALTKNTLYYYRVKSADAASNTGYGTASSFTTSNAACAPP